MIAGIRWRKKRTTEQETRRRSGGSGERSTPVCRGGPSERRTSVLLPPGPATHHRPHFQEGFWWPLGGAAQQTVDRWSGLLGETKNEEEVHLKHFLNISKREMKQIPLWMREKGISSPEKLAT